MKISPAPQNTGNRMMKCISRFQNGKLITYFECVKTLPSSYTDTQAENLFNQFNGLDDKKAPLVKS